MKHFHFSCQGESHKVTNKPCQDFSFSLTRDNLCISVVCDGHGGERYFRSDVGAKFCGEITVEAVKDFVSKVNKSLFEGKPFSQMKAISETTHTKKLNDTDKALRQLFASIIAKWNTKIEQYTDQNPLTEDELKKLDTKYIEAFEKRESLEKVYGCTLITYVQTNTFWLVFQIGDGKCVSFQQENKLWIEPVPWDDRCFLNKTTSICDSDAINEFRYCYTGNGHFPVVVFLGSDGIDDSFGLMDNLVDFYIQICKLFVVNQETAFDEIKTTLPELSRHGSKDDMSVACVYDEVQLKKIVPRMIRYQIRQIEQNINVEKSKLKKLENDIQQLTVSSDKDAINLEYYKKDCKKCKESISILENKLVKRQSELNAFVQERDCKTGHNTLNKKNKRPIIKINKILKIKKR